ncbi:hypothetical protein B0T25DRAFT_146187 [Lasiosphaeria hispida]|uniref:Uncharacterized protein n=1 Tax=Lasiosphaeria hispida TaxID=260671 RepID=A0AAJ0MFT5_9PEZI|nr:hypothetical protein B0T25DRAFT_146187 [Lasiosphaeria hispida]
MDVGLSVVEPQMEQEDYFLDLDADAEVEDFDFKLDGAYDTGVQYDPTAASAGDSTNQAADFEIGYEDDEGQAALIDDEHTHAIEVAVQDVNGEIGMDYQDEIGYEDEEPTATGAAETDVADKPEVEEANALDLEISASGPEEHDDSHQVFNDQTGIPKPKPEEAAVEDPTPKGPSEELMLHDDLGDHKEDMSGSGGHPSPSITSVNDESINQSPIPVHGSKSVVDNLESGNVDNKNSLPEFPGIEVHYDGGQYSLFGTPADDPDSYFLPDTKELDGPLTQFLASLRAVVSDEITAEDELVVRLGTLSFEFGEKSSNRFLRRSLRDILDSYAAIASKQAGSSQSLVLTLLIRRDCEDLFLELLEKAGILESSSATAYLTGDFENVDKASQPGAGGDEHPYRGSSIDDYSEKYEDEGEDHAASMVHDSSVQTTANEMQTGLDESRENGDDFAGETSDQQTNPSGPASVDSTRLEPNGEINYEEEYQEVQFEDYDNAEDVEEGGEDYADEDIDISGEPEDEEFAADEISFEIAPPFGQGQDDHNNLGDETGGQANNDMGTAAATTAAANTVATTAPGLTSNDDEGNFALDADPGLATIQKQEGGDDFTDAFDIMEDAGHDAEEADSPQHGGLHQDTTEFSGSSGLASNSPLNGAHASLTQEALSSYTSRTSTINGDEIDYDETNTANESLLETETPHQEVKSIGHDNDEIDWENDGDEEEEEQAVAPTSPSISGKRSRTDEVEGLVDETDYKRRRT